MEMSLIVGRGWKDEESRITPVWFLVEHLPPCLSQKRRIKAKNGYITDREEQEENVSFKGCFLGRITANYHGSNDSI